MSASQTAHELLQSIIKSQVKSTFFVFIQETDCTQVIHLKNEAKESKKKWRANLSLKNEELFRVSSPFNKERVIPTEVTSISSSHTHTHTCVHTCVQSKEDEVCLCVSALVSEVLGKCWYYFHRNGVSPCGLKCSRQPWE